MEFTITRDELQAALYLTQGVVERRTPVPILAHVLFSAEEDGIAVSATDQQIGVRRRCTAKVKKKGSATANGRMLYDIVRELPDGDVTVRVGDNFWIEISGGKSRFKVVGIDPKEFPAMPKMAREGEKQALEVPVPTLSEMINRTLFSVSTDETRVNLSGIFFERAAVGQLRMVATDGHRLAMITRPVATVTPGAGVIMPRKGVLELKRLLENGADEQIELSTKGNVVQTARGEVELTMRLVEGEFPDYKQVVPAASARRIVVELDLFQSALRRVSLVSSEISHGVRLSAETGQLKLSALNPERGEAEEEIAAEVDGGSITVGFNARYLLDVLAVLEPGSRVEIGLGDELSPGVIQTEGDAEYTYVVMPMRL